MFNSILTLFSSAISTINGIKINLVGFEFGILQLFLNIVIFGIISKLVLNALLHRE